MLYYILGKFYRLQMYYLYFHLESGEGEGSNNWSYIRKLICIVLYCDHLFGALKESLRGSRFLFDADVTEQDISGYLLHQILFATGLKM